MGGMSLRGSAGAFVATAAFLAAVSASAASAKDEAKLHFDAGLALVDNEDYAAAAVEFEASARLFPTKMGLYNLANCFKALRRYGDAIDAIERLEREFKGKLGDLQREVEALQETVEGIVGRLEVRVDREGAAILVDGVDAALSPLAKPLVLGPGDHAIEARLAGYETTSQTVRIVARDHLEVSFILVQAAQVPPSPAVVGPTQAPPPAAPIAAAAVQAQAAPQKVAPVAPPPRDPKGRVARAFGWTSMALAIVSGLVAGGAYVGASVATDDFNESRDSYEEIKGRLETEGPTVELLDAESSTWKAMEDDDEQGARAEKIGLGAAICAGALAATAITLLIVGSERREKRKAAATVAVAPNGVGVEF